MQHFTPPQMDARRFAEEAGISEAEAEKILAEAEEEKKRIDNEFYNDIEEMEIKKENDNRMPHKMMPWMDGPDMRREASTDRPKPLDRPKSLTELLDEDARMAEEAIRWSRAARVMGWISIALSLLSIGLAVLRRLFP